MCVMYGFWHRHRQCSSTPNKKLVNFKIIAIASSPLMYTVFFFSRFLQTWCVGLASIQRTFSIVVWIFDAMQINIVFKFQKLHIE